MKSLKNTLVALGATSFMLFSACTDLSETVYDKLADENIDVNDESVASALMGQSLVQLRYLYWGWNGYFDVMEECTDIYMTPKRIGIGWGDLYIPMHKHSWNSEQGHLEPLWDYAYRSIGFANKSIDILPETGYAQAQMRFVRALNYYILFDAFRSVPLETTKKTDVSILLEQETPETIYNFCVEELKAIKDDLGTENIFGYGNRYAACMALAKLYLNYNAYFGAEGTEYYEKALAEANEIIQSGNYSLAANYLDNHKQNISSSPEIIFAIPLNIIGASHNYLVNKCLVGAGAAAYGYNGSPWNGSCAVPQFISSYDPDDKRLADTWTGGIQYYATENSSGVIVPQSGNPIPFTDDDWSGTGYLNYSLQVHSIDNPGAYQQEGYRFVKSEIVAGTDGTYGNDVAFFRLADAMFIKAECLLRLGRDEQTAADLVNEVRKRSFDTVNKATRTVSDLKGGSRYDYGHREYTGEGYANWDRATYVSTTEGGADIQLGGLLDDLAWEFAGEHHRRQDLIRFKMTDGRNVFNGKSWFCKDATTETHWNYFPIPKSVMNANLSFEQNKGYE